MIIEALVGLAFVQANPPGAAPTVAPATVATETLPPAPARTGGRGVIGDEILAQSRGGETVIINGQTLSAVINGNVLGDYTAGAITISDQALSNFNGFGNLLINTGAQNSLQAGMSVTINVNP